jgi:uncharacterized protein
MIQTKLLNEFGQPKYTNRLLSSTSPYLRSHAHDPVDWYEWGSEALERAKREDRPILISVGYTACHWCHQVQIESFQDESTAALMNEHFVCIKVDREERPDIDSIYMSAVQAMTGSGGWPLHCWLLPDGRPFYGGTYFPPDEKAARYRMPSFKQVLRHLAEAYRTRRDELEHNSQELVQHIAQIARSQAPAGAAIPTLEEVLAAASEGMAQGFDERNGGFGGAPKFPQPMSLEFLLRAHLRGDAQALSMLTFTLQKMARGGMYDQLGGGFHRYSVDAFWLVPHFEKMLYDNALLARVYLETYQVTGEPFLRRIVEETLDYLVREMLHPNGGFYSTQDADSLPYPGAEHGEEGAFFVWTPNELREILGEDAVLFAHLYDVSVKGNFEGKSILNLPRTLEEVARITGASIERLQEVAAVGRKKLFTAREQRPKPFRDEKVLTAWNAMALRAFAAAAVVLERPDYLAVAQRNAEFLLQQMRTEQGRLVRNWIDGAAAGAGVPAFLEDYALLADGLLALHAVDGNWRWLHEALQLTDTLIELFWDDELGGFYDTAADHEQLVVRPRDVGDNATPSGNSVATEVLLRLAALSGNDSYREKAERVLGSLAPMMARFPSGFGRLLCAADLAASKVTELAIIGAADDQATRELVNVAVRSYRPHLVIARTNPARLEDAALALPLFQERTMINNQPTAFVCHGFVCQLPVTTGAALEEQFN